MNLAQAFQMSLEFASIDTRPSSRYPTFTPSEVIHRDSSKPGFPGKISADNRKKQHSLVVPKSGDNVGSLVRHFNESIASVWVFVASSI